MLLFLLNLAGQSAITGAATGTLRPTGAAAGIVTSGDLGDASGSIPLSGSGTGEVVVEGAGSDSVGISGSGTGTVADAGGGAVPPTGYATPTAADLKARYPAFAAVPDTTINYWITDALRFVDTSWMSGDYAPAILAVAAHNMTLAGFGTDSALLTGVPAGVTSMKSGALSLNFTPEAANARLAPDFTATRYGQEYTMLLRRNRGGPRVTDSGAFPPEYYNPAYPIGYPY